MKFYFLNKETNKSNLLCFCIGKLLNDCKIDDDNSKAEKKLDITLDFKIDSFFKLNYCEFDFGEIFLAYPVMSLSCDELGTREKKCCYLKF